MYLWKAAGLLCCLLLLEAGCGNNSAARREGESGRPAPQEAATSIAPNHCRIIGTIVSVDPDFRTGEPGTPTAEEPCLAVVRVDSVLGYGSAFGRPLAQGREIEVLFKFTLSPTKDLFPRLARHYPGLKAGSRFQADVELVSERPRESGAVAGYRHVVYGYEVK